MALQLARRFNVEKAALKDLTYGALLELMHNRRYYYHSSVGQDYSHWTEEGKLALIEYMNGISWKMIQAEDADLNKRAKEQTMAALKAVPK